METSTYVTTLVKRQYTLVKRHTDNEHHNMQIIDIRAQTTLGGGLAFQ